MSKVREILSKYKYPLLVLLVGLALLLWPQSGDESSLTAGSDDERRLEQVLESCSGVGECNVLLSDNGAVIVCDGAGSAETRYSVLKAVKAFSGFSSDRIQILKTSAK